MGLTKDFFTQPIPVPCTLSQTVVGEDGSITTTQETLLFLLRREEQKEADLAAQASILNPVSEHENRLVRFSGLLTEAPRGLDDFPLSTAEFQGRYKDKLDNIPAGTPVDEAAQVLRVVIDNRPVAERALEYFRPKDYEVLIRSVMVFYDRAAYPAELFRGL